MLRWVDGWAVGGPHHRVLPRFQDRHVTGKGDLGHPGIAAMSSCTRVWARSRSASLSHRHVERRGQQLLESGTSGRSPSVRRGSSRAARADQQQAARGRPGRPPGRLRRRDPPRCPGGRAPGARCSATRSDESCQRRRHAAQTRPVVATRPARRGAPAPASPRRRCPPPPGPWRRSGEAAATRPAARRRRRPARPGVRSRSPAAPPCAPRRAERRTHRELLPALTLRVRSMPATFAHAMSRMRATAAVSTRRTGRCGAIRVLWSGSSRRPFPLFVAGNWRCSRLDTTSSWRWTASIETPGLRRPTRTQLWAMRMLGPSPSPRRMGIHMSALSRNRNVEGRTPTTVAGTFRRKTVSVLPTAARALPKRRSARRAFIRTTYGAPAWASASVNRRPATGRTPSIGSRFWVTSSARTVSGRSPPNRRVSVAS
jgi:hypothetical protein